MAADENNIPFLASAITFDALLAAVPLLVLSLAALAQVLQGVAGTGPIDPRDLFERFLPPHDQSAADPFAVVEALLGRLATAGRTLQVVAIPAFLWFSTRLFAGVRTALNNIYDVSVRPPKGHYVVRYIRAKLRDLRMVLMSLVLFLAYTTLTTGISMVRNSGFMLQRLDSGVATLLSSWVVGLVALGFLIAFFFLLYRHASVRLVTWQAALVAAGFVAVGFEIARRLFSLYLGSVAGYGTASADASVGAIVLFVVWVYYSALVFLLGGVVAETWELRQLQREQRGEARQA